MFWLLLISVVCLTIFVLFIPRGKKTPNLIINAFAIIAICFVITFAVSIFFCIFAIDAIYQGKIAEEQIVYVEKQLNELNVIYSDVIETYIEKEERLYSDVGSGKIAYSQPGMKTIESLSKYIETQQELRNKMIELNETITKAKFARFLTFLF